MATALPLEDHISCAVCLEVYRNPHALKCLHTFCLECIKPLLQNNKVQCPECRKYCSAKDIQKDFKTAGLIDLFERQKLVSNQDSNNKIKEDENRHKSSQPIQDCLSKNVKSLQKLKSDISGKSHKVGEIIKQFQSVKQQQILQVDKYTQELKQALEKNSQDMKKVINGSNNEVIQNFLSMQSGLLGNEKEVQEKINMLNSLTRRQNVTKEETEQINKNCKDFINKAQLNLPRIEQPPRFPVRLEKGDKIDLAKGLRVTLDMDMDDNQDPSETKPASNPKNKNDSRKKEDGPVANNSSVFQSQLHSRYSQMLRNKYKLAGHIILPNKHWKICFTDGKLLGLENDHIQIYNSIDGTLEGTIKLQKGLARGLACQDNTYAITAHTDYGLHEVNFKTHQYIGQIATGSFSDVTWYETNLYVLIHQSPRVAHFNYNGTCWVKIREINLAFDSPDSFDKICFHDNWIYLSSWKNCCVYIFDAIGNLKKQVGKQDEGGSIPGALKQPRICDVDTEGNILVSDCDNHRFQVYKKREDAWKIIYPQGEMKNPMQAVVSEHAGKVWVLLSKNKILKFIKT